VRLACNERLLLGCGAGCVLCARVRSDPVSLIRGRVLPTLPGDPERGRIGRRQAGALLVRIQCRPRARATNPDTGDRAAAVALPRLWEAVTTPDATLHFDVSVGPC